MGCGASKVANTGGKGPLDSVIINDFPSIFDDLRKSQFHLLWRATRDGFSSRDFHGHCDGHPNTLTIVLDSKGHIFGGYTTQAWESRTRDPYKADASGSSFLFTLHNPLKSPARKFRLKSDQKKSAIACEYSWGPTFGEGDLFISSNANSQEYSYTRYFGDTYENPTGFPGSNFFTGRTHFTAADIEVFEVSQSGPTLPPAVQPISPGEPSAPGSPESVIIREFPELFDDLNEKRFILLWRGSRDGLQPAVFHARCDDHPNTLTVVLDTKGNIFGGFTTVPWKSPAVGQSYADDSRESWLFSLKNPTEFKPEKFGLRPTHTNLAIYCHALAGPTFDEDIAILDGANGYSQLGNAYRNTTGLPGTIALAGSQCFTVKDIEVFELIT
jgi:hypothetical protein